MKTMIALTLSAVLTAGMLTGCGCSRQDMVPETTVPLATVRPTTEPTREPMTRPTFTEPAFTDPAYTDSTYREETADPTIEDGNGPMPTESAAEN